MGFRVLKPLSHPQARTLCDQELRTREATLLTCEQSLRTCEQNLQTCEEKLRASGEALEMCEEKLQASYETSLVLEQVYIYPLRSPLFFLLGQILPRRIQEWYEGGSGPYTPNPKRQTLPQACGASRLVTCCLTKH